MFILVFFQASRAKTTRIKDNKVQGSFLVNRMKSGTVPNAYNQNCLAASIMNHSPIPLQRLRLQGLSQKNTTFRHKGEGGREVGE